MSAIKTPSERQRTHYAKMKAAGMIRVFVWVPKGAQKLIQDLARKLRLK